MDCMSADTIRKMFIDFFIENGHKYYHSSSVVLPEDPTLLFVNAGMNQFKSVFTGQVDPRSKLAKIKRAVNSQKCIRAGGKHNDLEDVGKDVYHHTFFEMLGNWSFGDFFKKEAIDFAWRFLVERMHFETDRMYATYFEGDEASSLPPDLETRDLWLKYLPEERVLPGSLKDNFWEMGDVGPCGPCTEIHYDRIGGRNAANLVNKDDPDVLEVWNIVFIQFNREADGELRLLPNSHVDTGMGLERLVSVVQKKRSNYDTDIFMPIFAEIQKITGFERAYSGKVGDADIGQIDQAYRVIADHCRTLVIAISDGVRPDNTGRGYVIRRILRRAVRFAFEKLKAKAGFMAQIARSVAEILSKTFPEVATHIQFIEFILSEEEGQFLRTMSRGRKFFEKSVEGSHDGVFPGELAWRLYDTYGFPVDLTELMCEERGLSIDMKGFEQAKQSALEQSKAGSNFSSNQAGDNSKTIVTSRSVEVLRSKNVQLTDDSYKYTVYEYNNSIRDYEYQTIMCKVLAIICDDQLVEKADNGSLCAVVLDKTCFYAESGGQIGDRGTLSAKDLDVYVTDTQNFAGYILHYALVNDGCLKVGEIVEASIDGLNRTALMRNHTGTHVLNMALRQRLGSSAEQKGSLVTADRLRFDVSCQKSIQLEDLKVIEETCRRYINEGHVTHIKVLPIDDARKVPMVRTLQDEKYPANVRVVSLGSIDEFKSGQGDEPYMSVELCGGTHLRNTKHIDAFCLISSEPLAKGIRRLQAVTGPAASDALMRAMLMRSNIDELMGRTKVHLSKQDENLLNQIDADALAFQATLTQSVMPYTEREECRKNLEQIRLHVIEAHKENLNCKVKKAIESVQNLIADDIEKNGSTPRAFISVVDLSDNRKSLNNVVSVIKSKYDRLPLMLFSTDKTKGKTICQAHVPTELSSLLKANEWTSVVAEKLNGKSGGSTSSAQASGDNTDVLPSVTKVAEHFASMKLSYEPVSNSSTINGK